MSTPFMQLYVADYLGDTRHLTTEQHGAYLLILMAMWRADGRLPNDQKRLARIAGCTPARWSRIGAEVMEFFAVDGDELTNNRLGKELKKARERSLVRAEAGTRGGKATALKTKRTAPANDAGLLQHSSEPEPEEGSEDKSSDAETRVVTLDHDGEAWRQAVRLLTTQGRMTEAKARPFFGRLISAHKLQPRDLLPSLAAATVSGTQDPQGYLTKAAEAVANRRAGPVKEKRVAWV